MTFISKFVVYIIGRLRAAKNVCWMRSQENMPVSTRQSDRTFSFESWWLDPKSEGERQKFIRRITESVPNQADSSVADFVQQAATAFIEDQKQKRSANGGLPGVKTWVVSGIGKLFRKVLPFEAFLWVLNAYGFMTKMRKGRTPDEPGVSLENLRRVKIDDRQREELTWLEGLVTGFHDARRAVANRGR